MLNDAIGEKHLLMLVDLLDCFQNVRGTVSFQCDLSQCLDVFGKARASITNARVKKGHSNSGICSNTAADIHDVRADGIAKPRKLIHKRNTGR